MEPNVESESVATSSGQNRGRGGCRGERGSLRRARGDEGAALVEFALIMPILCLLLFGLVEFGINVNDYEAIRQGTRDAARQAVVGDWSSGTCASTNAADGTANATAVQCLARKGAGLTTLAVKVVYTDNGTGNDYSQDRVKVCSVAKAKSITGLLKPFLSNVYLKTRVEMRAEKQLTLNNKADTDPSESGAGWSWC